MKNFEFYAADLVCGVEDFGDLYDLFEKHNNVYYDPRDYSTLQMIIAWLLEEHEETDETCRNESELNLADGFECSNCGIRIEGYEEVEFDDECTYVKNYSEYRPRYCPNCGRRIKDE